MEKDIKEYIKATEVLVENHQAIYARLQKTMEIYGKTWDEIEAETVSKIVKDVFVDLCTAKFYLQLMTLGVSMNPDEEVYFQGFSEAMNAVYQDLNQNLPE